MWDLLYGSGLAAGPVALLPRAGGHRPELGFSVCMCVVIFFVLFNFFSSNLNSRVLLVSVYIGQVTVL